MRALFPGRFQPFHLGHLHALMKILDENEYIIILIENADESFTFRNPLTAGERFEMILNVIRELGKNSRNIFPVPVEIVKNNADWVNHLRSILPPFDVCYSNNDLVRMLMERSNVKVLGIDFLDRDRYQGSEVRKMIAMDKPWKNLVPESVYEYIVNNEIDKRIKRLAGMVP